MIEEEDSFILIFEHCDGDLYEYLEKYAPLNEEEARCLIYQMGQGYWPLHPEVHEPTNKDMREIMHRDIKPGNILLKYTPAGPVLKIGDFGCAKYVD